MIGGVIWKSDWVLMNRAWGWDYLARNLRVTLWRYRTSWMPLYSTTWGKGYPGVIQRNESRKALLVQGQWK